MYVLSGDIGGTNTRLEISFVEKNKIESIGILKYKGADFNSLTEIIHKFLNDLPIDGKINSVCLAVAGVVQEGEVEITNLPWLVSETYIAETLNIEKEKVKIINDFEAIGYGIDDLDKEKDLFTLQEGKENPNSLNSILGAGTGLGACIVSHDSNGRPNVFKTEGGHVDFAPVDDEHVELFKFLRKTLHRVSVERVCCGYGIYNIYKYVVRNPLYEQPENSELRRELYSVRDTQKAEIIAKYAIEYKDPSALRTIDLFLSIYGSVTGNLALTTFPLRGLYIAGGIAPKLIEQIKTSKFLTKFRDKGRMSKIMTDFPIHIIMNTNVGLIGARRYAINLT